jgi:hypothetical protein
MYTVSNIYKMTSLEKLCNKHIIMSLEELCAKKFINDGRKLNEDDLHKHLMGLHVMPKSVFVKSDLFEKLITNFSINVLQYIDVEKIINHISYLKSPDIFIDFIDINLANKFLKSSLINDEIIEFLIKNFFSYEEIPELAKSIPKQHLSSKIMELLINKCNNRHLEKLKDVIGFSNYNAIMTTEKYLKQLEEIISKKNDSSWYKYEILKSPHITNENIKLLITKTNKYCICTLAKNIPEIYFNSEIIKLLIDKCDGTHICKLKELIC